MHTVAWNPDSFTLSGLPVNPTSTVLAGDYFSNDPAHKGQARYYLNPAGTWLPLADTAALQRGQAYWFYTTGTTTYQAGVDFTYGGGASIDYGSSTSQRNFSFVNRTSSSVQITLAAPTGIPLSYQTTDPTTKQSIWTPLTSYTQTIAAGASQGLTVGVLRSQLPAGSDVGALCNLRVRAVATNGVTPKLDSLFKVPVTALGTDAVAAGGSANVGLWIGTATIDHADEVNTTAGSVDGNGVVTITTPSARTVTPSPFTLRLLLHVDTGGAVQLLKQVIVMQKTAASTDPAAPVLLTDPTLIPRFDAPARRNGAPFAYRLSSVGFDFAGNNLPLAGSFAQGSSVTGTVSVPRTLPTNPFLHRYNPDHDDVPKGNNEVWDVSRALTLTFNGTNTNTNQPGADGSSQIAGTYQETLTGLHRFPITVAGNFTLRRVNSVGALDPAP